MPLKIQFTIEGDKQIDVLMDRMVKGVSNFREPLQESATYMQKQIQNQFSTEGGQFKGTPGGSKWDRLSEPYGTNKSKSYPGKGILSKTGKMQRSFRSVVSRSVATIFNTSSYFKYHQSNKARSKLPRRVMLAIGTGQQTQIFKFFNKYLNKLRNG